MVKRIARLGFTLVELLVVMVIITTLLTLAVPRYFHSVDKSKETVLKDDLALMRDAIQHYYADKGMYPEKLQDLESERYLRRIPVDPITDSALTWVVVAPEDSTKGAVYDVQSGAPGKSLDGVPYAQW